MKTALFFLILCQLASARDWYVRPTAQGAHDGTSYVNAWGGFGKIVWGSGGVHAGDTLYICGTHLYITNFAFKANAVNADGTTTAPITLRGDYPDDPGIIIGARKAVHSTFTNRGDGTFALTMATTLEAWQGDPATNGALLQSVATTATCVSTAGTFHREPVGGNDKIIYHPYPGIADDFYGNWVGGGLWLNGHHDLVIKSLRMFGGGSTGIVCLNKAGPVPVNITIDCCELAYGYYTGVYADTGSSGIHLTNSKLHDVATGTYTVGGDNDGWTIQNVEVYGGGDARNLFYPLVTRSDRQALGGQNMRNLLIENCNIHDWPGDGIIDYVYSGALMDNVVIRYNKFTNLNDPDNINYHYGIAKTGTNWDQFENNTTGWEIYNNNFVNLGGSLAMSTSAGAAIRLKGGAADDGSQTMVHDNVFYDCNCGIFNLTSTMDVGFTGRNNISLYPKTGGYHVYISNYIGSSTLAMDHDTYAPDGALWSWKSIRQPSFFAWQTSSGVDLQ